MSLSLAGCSSEEAGDSDETLAELGIDDGASAGVRQAQLVKAAEGAELKLKTGAHLSIPEGALDKDTTITIERPADRKAVQLVKTMEPGYRVASAPYVLTPHGTKFKQDVELTLPISKGENNRLAVAYLEDEQDKTWEIIESAPGIAGKFAGLALAHFSVLVLVEIEEGGPLPERDAQTPGDGLPGMDGGVTAAEGGTGTAMEAGSDPADEGGAGQADFKTRLIAKFEECQLLSSQGDYTFSHEPGNDTQACEAECLLNAVCSDFAGQWCENDVPVSPDYELCIEHCYGIQYVTCIDPVTGGQYTGILCNNVVECAGGADELDCNPNLFFQCDVQQRVMAYERCDGNEDCGNGADEVGCPAGIHFQCASGQRIPAVEQCDTFRTCDDGSDELGCTFFQCNDGTPIALRWECDLTPDCPDGSDEGANCMQVTCENYQQPTQLSVHMPH